MSLSREVHDREADINRFAMIGMMTVLIIGAGIWGLRTYIRESRHRSLASRE
jgi:hypothetical protein